jgi:ABC-2 type transport system permease protein
MKRIMLVAAREFIATTGNKGFLIGLLIMPAMIGVIAVVAPRITSARSPQVVGEVAVVDPTGKVGGELRQALSIEEITARRREAVQQTLANNPAGEAARRAGAQQAAEQALGATPNLTVVEQPAGGDLQQQKQWLLQQGGTRHLALVVLHPTAVERPAGTADFGGYDLYVSGTLDDATEGVIYEGIRQALITARMRARNVDRAVVDATMRVTRPRSVIVTEAGEQQAQRGFTRVLPFILGILLFMGIMIGGQTLMTSTIEEKSSRVIEVLLAAVSPIELMWGKLLGQLAVGLLVMSVYAGLGILALFQFAMLGLLDPMVVVYLLLFFVLSYLFYGALMMAIGASVNQVAEAQSMMGPVMILMVAPYILTSFIGRAPNSTISVAASFIPPVNAFAMMARLASDSPPPAWQVGVTALLSVAAACGTVWFAAKIFKIGLLMHGKPPTLGTLVRWARQA